MSSEEFVENFISSCIDKGIKSQKDICNAALEQIQEIDIKLRESNNLRILQKNLRQVLRELGHESIKKPKSNEEISISGEIGQITDSAYLNLMIKICDFIEENSDKAITGREIINGVGTLDNNTEVYMCIKALYENGILARDEGKDRNVLKGPKWNERPFNEELNNKSA